jgi:hypothetical protein
VGAQLCPRSASRATGHPAVAQHNPPALPHARRAPHVAPANPMPSRAGAQLCPRAGGAPGRRAGPGKERGETAGEVGARGRG